MTKLTSICLLLVLSACSQKGMYEALQRNQQIECSQLPPSQYQECMDNASESYEDYSRKRNETLER